MKVNVTGKILNIDGTQAILVEGDGSKKPLSVRSAIISALLSAKLPGDDMERKLKVHRLAMRVQAQDEVSLHPLECADILQRANETYGPLVLGQLNALLNDSPEDVVKVSSENADAK